MYPHFQKMLVVSLMLSTQLTTLFAQNTDANAKVNVEEIVTSPTLNTKKLPQYRLQHTASFGTRGFEYDMRIRTEHPLLDYYFATNWNGNGISGAQGGVVIGKKSDISFVAGVGLMTNENIEQVLNGTNVALALPVGIRCQPDGRGLFLQAQYMPTIGNQGGLNFRNNIPQIQLGYTFGKKPERDTLPTPQGIQESFALELNPNYGTNLRYDARFRTKSTWLDWAAHGSIGTNLLNSNAGETYFRNNWATNAGVGVSALVGKKALSFELGARLNTHFGAQNAFNNISNFVPNRLNDNLFNSSSAEIFGGLRYQPPRSGVTIMLNTALTRDFDRNPNYYRSNNPEPIFDRFSLRLGLGYSLGTKVKK